jgi:hypothetical protein
LPIWTSTDCERFPYNGKTKRVQHNQYMYCLI